MHIYTDTIPSKALRGDNNPPLYSNIEMWPNQKVLKGIIAEPVSALNILEFFCYLS
jgi:hypothetical protein